MGHAASSEAYDAFKDRPRQRRIDALTLAGTCQYADREGKPSHLLFGGRFVVHPAEKALWKLE
jgi:hypothetical protein